MSPVDDVGRVIEVDFGRESLSRPVPLRDCGTDEERQPDVWQPLGYVVKRVIARLPDPNR